MSDNESRYMVRHVTITHDGNKSTSEVIGELAKDVAGYVKEGWRPTGGITSFQDGRDIVLCQALLLPGRPESAG